MISFGSCIYPTLGSVKVSPSRVASPENYKHQTLKVSGVTPRPELPPITLRNSRVSYAYYLVGKLSVLPDFAETLHHGEKSGSSC